MLWPDTNMRADMQIEAILKPKKGLRSKRKLKDVDDVLDHFANEEKLRCLLKRRWRMSAEQGELPAT